MALYEKPAQRRHATDDTSTEYELSLLGSSVHGALSNMKQR
jgi:hypothetical protein